ncbi:uncharacterized protein LOC132552240 [Ylistrum balloti]|uniref:uncharacterized protein LOC132552240 n=1 Tax=Ylistrum balloti TaxID=509963 RepID=UPI002905A179|nr:uncharacterized protein LOC132552240 [Ylistrum balloti]
MMEGIPFKYVSQDTWIQLANKLDFDTMMGNNWKMLAEKLGYEVEDILNIECRQTRHGRNTVKLFEDYVKRSGNSVTKLRKALESMDRPDALDVLLDAIPEIERKYTAAMRNNNRRVKIEPGENSYNFPSGCCSGSCVSSSVANSGISQHHNMNVCPNQFSVYNLQHCPDMSSHSLHVTKELNTMPHNYQSYSSPASVQHTGVHTPRNSSQYMSTYTSSSMNDESMEVNIDVADHYLQENIQMDNESESVSRLWPKDEKAALPRTIFKATNYLPSLNRVPPLINYNDMQVGNEEVVETTERMSGHATAQFGRQLSEEMNANQPLVDPQGMPAASNANLGLNLQVRPKKGQQTPVDKKKFCSPSPTTPGNPLAKLQQFTNSESYMPNEEYNSIMAAKNREEMLYNRSNLEDVQCRLRGGGDQGIVHREPQTEEDFQMIFNFNAGFRNHRGVHEQQLQIQNQRVMKDKGPANKEPPKTFPRAKSMMHCTSTVGGAQGNQSAECMSGLTKSKSMPDDMKPVEYQRKNFWHIKVFVTYSNDCKRHIQRVLNLCRCLEKNGFTCCMDVNDRKMVDSHNKLEWCNQRFSEADFVLVCVSPNYLTEATCIVENNDSALHTAYIYQLMESEIQSGGGDLETRFIPIMFDESRPEDIPKIMQHRLSYQWPKQYRDLLWYLTKPETRTKTKASNYVEQCPRSPKSPNIPT